MHHIYTYKKYTNNCASKITGKIFQSCFSGKSQKVCKPDSNVKNELRKPDSANLYNFST